MPSGIKWAKLLRGLNSSAENRVSAKILTYLDMPRTEKTGNVRTKT